METDNIEYLGINVNGTGITNVKKYYLWDDRERPGDFILSEHLKIFDFGLRNEGADYSISSFVKNATPELFSYCVENIIEHYGMCIGREFTEKFCRFQQFEKGIHYDPIISFKYKGEKVDEVSFYVTALRDKSYVNEYMEQVIPSFFNANDATVGFIRYVVLSRLADMFQVAWDYNANGLKQRKVYLKVKQLEGFVKEMETVFPNLGALSNQQGYRFCELAFVVKEKNVKSFNMYFKPL